MFTLSKQIYNPAMNQDRYTYKNEENVTATIYVDRDKRDFLSSKVETVIIKDPYAAVYGMSLSYSLDEFTLASERSFMYPVSELDNLLKIIDREGKIADELEKIIKQYK